MSEENVQIVKRVYEAAARGDSATVFALYDRDVVLDSTRLQVLGLGFERVFRGHEGLRSFFREWHEAWQTVEYDFDELIDAPGAHVVSVVTRRARGRQSGADVELSVSLVWTVREGKVSRVVWFPERDEALAAAGLPT